MQDIAARSVLRGAVQALDPFRQHRDTRARVLSYRLACVILGEDVQSFVCCSRLDGDRRFEVRP